MDTVHEGTVVKLKDKAGELESLLSDTKVFKYASNLFKVHFQNKQSWRETI